VGYWFWEAPTLTKAFVDTLRSMTVRSGDINPIGAISKTDWKRFIAYARDAFDLVVLDEFLDAIPTAEFEPKHCSESYSPDDNSHLKHSGPDIYLLLIAL